MTTFQLRPYADKIQEIADIITSILRLPVTVADASLYRIAGTGIYREKIGTKLPGDCVFAKCAASGEPYFVADAGRDALCAPCSQRQECREKADVCTPIFLDEDVVGVIGIFAEDERQHTFLLSESDTVLNYLNRMAMLISQDIYSSVLFSELEKEKKRLEITLNSISEGIIMVDREGRIVEFNEKAKQYLDHVNFRKGTEIEKVLPVPSASLSRLLSGEMSQVNLSYYKEKSYHQFICIPNPVQYEERVENIVFTIYPLEKVHKAVNRLLYDDGLRLAGIIGESQQIHKLKRDLLRVAATDSVVLITGESGTGKELCARILHNESRRSNETFLAINCAALPESLIESELFGYEDGAFSGAKRGGKPGMFELAHKGTVFLDEIGEIPMHIQPKLLRVLEEKQITRVGGVRANKVDVRIISASNKDLFKLSREGRFREDLFYRLDVIPIHLPPLRERLEDIPLLVRHFLSHFSTIMGKEIQGIEDRLLEAFQSYGWPGNIRELENVVEYGVSFADGPILEYATVAPRLKLPETEVPAGMRNAAHGGIEVVPEDGTYRPTEAYERHIIRQLLEEHGTGLKGKRAVAGRLGVSQATLYRRLKKYGLGNSHL